jgi:hypothetical protein
LRLRENLSLIVARSPRLRRWIAGDQAARLLLAVFTAAIFTSAFLLFLVQPLFSRMALPLLGGSPAVWNTCLLFFQVTLLGGYLYAHLTTRWLGLRRQAAVHLVLVVAAVVSLPLGIPSGFREPDPTSPTLWLLLLLTVSLGLPFFVLSTTGPLLQRWFAGTDHPDAGNPYFLYAASNLGSLIALFGYPFLVEPFLTLRQQTTGWTLGYGVFLAGIGGCALLLWRATRPTEWKGRAGDEGDVDAGPAPTLARRAHWLLLAFAPSSLLLGVTTYITTDIAAVPLLWVFPLGLYLLSFVLAFARRPWVGSRWLARPHAYLLILLALLLFWGAARPCASVLSLHLAAFFVTALLCHSRLAEDRPGVAHLTGFYLWLAAGGALGGIFNALLAPHLFTGVVEYPLAIVIACALRSSFSRGSRLTSGLDLLLPLALGLAAAGAHWGVRQELVPVSAATVLAVTLGLGFALLSFGPRPVRFGLGIGAVIAAGALGVVRDGEIVHRERTFFGTHRVERTADGSYHRLMHLTTLHGAQSLDPEQRLVPTTYYHPNGPVGQIFEAARARHATLRVGLVGLGTGAIACHGVLGERWRYFEIDPAVVRIARDPRFFTYLRDCPPEVDVVLGDARLTLAREPAGAYELIVLDAFSSDAIPIHLMTREAVSLYLEKLGPGGLLAFHISNRHMDLEPVLARLAESLGRPALVTRQGAPPHPMHKGSHWFVMAGRDSRDPGPGAAEPAASVEVPPILERLVADDRWRAPLTRPRVGVWTDDFFSILGVYRWR